MRSRTIALAISALISALLLAGCAQQDSMGGMSHGSNPTPSSGASSDANAADRMFVMMMIPHHEQAIEMAELLLEKEGVDTRAVDLARQIKEAQQPEIETMKGWLQAWGIPYDDSMMSGGMGGMEHGGMMSQEDLDALRSATGTGATRMFLEGMIAHHQGAIDMARSVIDNGRDSDVRALAEQMIETQAAEITEMQELLSGL